MLPKCLLFIRHAESQKNISENFDGDALLDHLTDAGKLKVLELRGIMAAISDASDVMFYTADSGRARETRDIMTGGRAQISVSVASFGSMKSGPFAGLSDRELLTLYPEFFQDLQLFRAGVLSGYAMRTPPGAESWVQFEQRVLESLLQVESDSHPVRIVVCHRSAMMVVLTYFARKMLGYPLQHFGFFNVPPLFSALIHQGEEERIFRVGACRDLLRFTADSLAI